MVDASYVHANGVFTLESNAVLPQSYNVFPLITNASLGFRVVLHYIELNDGGELRIGTGNGPFDNQTLLTSIRGYSDTCDFFTKTNELWIAVIGGLFCCDYVNIDVIATEISGNQNVYSDLLYLTYEMKTTRYMINYYIIIVKFSINCQRTRNFSWIVT